MASKYLGSLGRWDFFIATAYGEYRDEEAVREIQKARYKLITEARSKRKRKPIDIFCTAINLDHDTQREISYFDDLETTYHIFAIGNDKTNKGRLGAVCSYALESQERNGSVIIGLPQENKVSNGYPEGFDLDEFRETYEYHGKKSQPEQRVELFRHFKPIEYAGDKVVTLGVYKGGFQEFIKERAKNGKTAATKWLFCSKPTDYQYLYRPLSAMLVPLLINGINNNDASPSLDKMIVLKDDHSKDSGGYFYNGIKISYRYPIIISRNPKEEKTERWFDFMSQIVDMDRADDIARDDKHFKRHRQLDWIRCRIVAEDIFIKHHGDFIDKTINYFAKKLARAYPYRGWCGELIEEPITTQI